MQNIVSAKKICEMLSGIIITMTTQKSFEKYLETEFTFCGTSELEKSMQ